MADSWLIHARAIWWMLLAQLVRGAFPRGLHGGQQQPDEDADDRDDDQQFDERKGLAKSPPPRRGTAIQRASHNTPPSKPGKCPPDTLAREARSRLP